LKYVVVEAKKHMTILISTACQRIAVIDAKQSPRVSILGVNNLTINIDLNIIGENLHIQ